MHFAQGDRIGRGVQAAVGDAHEDAAVQAAFFKLERLTLAEQSSLEVEAPCLVAIDARAPVMRVHVADPTHTRTAVKLWLTGRYAGNDTPYDEETERTELTVALPQQGLAGKTVAIELRQDQP